MSFNTLSQNEFLELTHLRNVSVLVSGLINAQQGQGQDITAQQGEHLASMVHLFSIQLEQLVDGCQERIMTEEVGGEQ